MITLICSDDREDNIDHIYGLVSEGAAAGRRQLVIVPETHSHYAEKRLLAQCGVCPGQDLFARVGQVTRGKPGQNDAGRRRRTDAYYV